MRFALLQPNVSNTDIESNYKKVSDFCDWAKKRNCDLAILPSEAFFGVSEKQPDLFLQTKTLQEAASKLKLSIPVLCCKKEGRAFLLNNDAIFHLSNNLEFASRLFVFSGKPPLLSSNQLPALQVHSKSCPWNLGKYPEYLENLRRDALRTSSWIIAPSITGGYKNLVYDGRSAIINSFGEIMKIGHAFSEDWILFDLNEPESSGTSEIDHATDLWQALVVGTRDFIKKSGNAKAVIGLSGGMDSALVACVCAEALKPQNVLAILMPSIYTSDASNDDAILLAKNLGISTFTLPIINIKESYDATLAKIFAKFATFPGDLTEENLQARIRGTLLMTVANRTGALVMNTGNKSEALMGYCTLYGDTIGALAIIGDLYKTQVYELALWYNKNICRTIPENIFSKPPSAELKPNQKDEDYLPPYSSLDPCLAFLMGESSEDLSGYKRLEEIRERLAKNSFKRAFYPPALKVGYSSA